MILLILFLIGLFWDYKINSPKTHETYDVIIIGAGISGLNQLHLLRKAGFSVQVIEKNSDIAGTWRVNSYPGCKIDIRSNDYYINNPILNEEFHFTEEFSSQPELLNHINKMDELLNLSSSIHFNTKVTKLIWNDNSKTWIVTTNNRYYRTKFVILATGVLSKPNKPKIPGLNNFKGEIYYSSEWPEKVNLTGKRIGIVGTGSSGIQMIPIIAQEAEHLTVFQRRPNYVFPLRNHPIDTQFNKEERRKEALNSSFGVPITTKPVPYAELGKEKFLEQLEYYYQNIGGFDFTFSIISDLVMNAEADLVVQDFIRNKIREIVKNPITAEKLCPNYGYICKRPILGTDYYETYNRPNVELTTDTTTIDFNQFDAFIFATGFDAFVGASNAIHIVGRNGQVLKEKYDNYVYVFHILLLNNYVKKAKANNQ